MNIPRIELLKQFLADEPNEPFNLYALATEYLPYEPHTAMGYYERLLEEHPSYLGTYYHAGKLYHSFGNTARAIEVLELGRKLALESKNAKAFQELGNALREIEDEQYD